MIPNDLSLENIIKVHKKLSTHVLDTPLFKAWPLIDKIFNTNIYLKMEFLQHAGTFKTRGAVNNILNLNDSYKSNGITAVSAGNHAIATSYVANKFKLKNKIFIYDSAYKYRVDKCKEMNANVFFTNPHSAFKDVEKTSKEEGYYFIHPFDGKYTLQGTASLGLEICKQMEKIDNIIISVGGGGLIGGVGSAIKQIYPNCNVIGVEPEGAQGLTDSLKLNEPIKNVNINTIADSLSAPLHMPYSFSVCKEVIDQIVTVSDSEMINAMRFMFEKSKMLLEPACVAGIAALLGPLKNKFKNQNTLVVLCGSNIDAKSWHNLVFK